VEGEKGFRVIGPYDMYDFTYSQQTGNRSVTGIAVERRITSALLFAGTGTTPVVYEITGHEETSLSSVRMQEMVERENYALQQINLIRVDIPKDASALVLNGPKSDLSRGEADKILAYLAGGGRFLVLADFRIRELPVLNDLLTSYGIRFDYGVVVETNRAYHPGNPYLLIPEGADHDIVKPLTEKNSPLVLPRVMGVSLLDTKRRTINAVPLLTSSGDSFLRTDLSSDSQTKIPSDMSGPITLGMAVMDPQYPENNQPQARVVAIGTGALLEPVPEFAYQQMPGNIDFFMNSLTWLEDRPETISVRSKSLFLLPMRMNELQIIIFGGLFTILIPLAFFVSGFITWLKRRHL
jgi:hypothetical protein